MGEGRVNKIEKEREGGREGGREASSERASDFMCG